MKLAIQRFIDTRTDEQRKSHMTRRYRGPGKEPLMSRFVKKFEPKENGCWLWTGTTNAAGYGMFYDRTGHSVPAHRASWRLHNGEIPSGMCVCHRCDVRCCVNPDHLFLGTQAENIADMNAKGRRVGLRKVTPADVIAIRAQGDLGIRLSTLAQEYGLTYCSVYRIVKRTAWGHI